MVQYTLDLRDFQHESDISPRNCESQLQRAVSTMVTKSIGANSKILALLCSFLPLLKLNVDLFEIWVQSLSIAVRFALPNVFSSNTTLFQERGLSFHLRGDSLSRPLRGRQTTLAAIFRCVPTTFGNDCSWDSWINYSCNPT